jgi:hypothetical protein
METYIVEAKTLHELASQHHNLWLSLQCHATKTLEELASHLLVFVINPDTVLIHRFLSLQMSYLISPRSDHSFRPARSGFNSNLTIQALNIFFQSRSELLTPKVSFFQPR